MFYVLVPSRVWGIVNICEKTSIFPSHKPLKLEESQTWHIKFLKKRKRRNGAVPSETCTILVPINENLKQKHLSLEGKRGWEGGDVRGVKPLHIFCHFWTPY